MELQDSLSKVHLICIHAKILKKTFSFPSSNKQLHSGIPFSGSCLVSQLTSPRPSPSPKSKVQAQVKSKKGKGNLTFLLSLKSYGTPPTPPSSRRTLSKTHLKCLGGSSWWSRVHLVTLGYTQSVTEFTGLSLSTTSLVFLDICIYLKLNLSFNLKLIR